MKLKILVTSDYYGKNVPGGAYKSLRIIIDGLLEYKNIFIRILSLDVMKKERKKISLIPLNPIISLIQRKVKKYIRLFGAVFFLYSFQILNAINKFKPHIIITQRDVAFPTILCAKIKQIPVIHIVRDTINCCPKRVDIIKFGKACPALESKINCYNCINYWRTLRVLLGDKPRGWENSIKSLIYCVFYKFRYYLIKLNFKLMNETSMNAVGSPKVKKILSKNVNSDKIIVINIVPIEMKEKINQGSKEINDNLVSEIESIQHPILFITPIFKGFQKGENFIMDIASRLPETFKIILVGKKVNLEKKNKNILNLDFIPSDILNYLYEKSEITLVPSFLTETFGRIIIESITNKTPVISSPNCGANFFFKEKKFLKVVPLKVNLWIKTIKQMIENPPIIKDEDVDLVYKLFSVDKSNKDFINLIRDVIKENYR